MPAENPQEAFHHWLAESLRNAWRALTDEPRDAYLRGATDHADLERRMRVYERRRDSEFFR
jgi:hypothetical protein